LMTAKKAAKKWQKNSKKEQSIKRAALFAA
jgi:hypothetical protein